MSSNSPQTAHKKNALEFKSSSLSVPVLVLFDPDPFTVKQQLKEKIQQAPDFFKNSPVLVDIQAVKDSTINIVETINIIRELKLLPIGLCNGTKAQNEAALKLDIPVQPSTQTKSVPLPVEETKPVDVESSQEQAGSEPTQEEAEESSSEKKSTMLISQPVRSGQRIYADGDLIIMAQVSAGAEVMAEGNIHIYNRLRGRALAGVRGNTEARIFCNDIQAELISIAGNYKISEDLTDEIKNKPVQVYLKDQALIIEDI